jgi:predicted transport protein
MDQAEKTMIENLHKNTGKTLEEWIKIVKSESFEKHGQMVKFLKENHNFTHGFANMVALKAREADAGSATDVNDLVEAQYAGKEHFRPLYERLLTQIKQFGSDVEVAPKKAYVSLKRKKQFAMLQPATKTRFEIGLNVKGREADGKLEPITKSNAMFTHVIKIASEEEADDKVLNWLKEAYEQAG